MKAVVTASKPRLCSAIQRSRTSATGRRGAKIQILAQKRTALKTFRHILRVVLEWRAHSSSTTSSYVLLAGVS